MADCAVPDDKDFKIKISRTDNFILRKNRLEVTFILSNSADILFSPQFEISDKVAVQFKVRRWPQINYGINCVKTSITISEVFSNIHSDDPYTYIINFSLTSSLCNIVNKQITCNNDGDWRNIHELDEGTSYLKEFTVIISIEHKKIAAREPLTFASLHDDEELTDFELRSEDGSIRVHRAVIATASPVLKRMLCGTWKETSDGLVDMPGTTKSTLQSLKDYIYLQKLPETGLEQLVLLASYYMMTDLEEMCVDALVQALTPQNVLQTIEFALKNKANRLMFAVLESFQDGKIMVKDIKAHFNSV